MQLVRIAWRRDVRTRAFKVALLIGTLLVLINQSGVILAHGLDSATALRCALTYLVPYLVSTHSSVAAIQANVQAHHR